MKLLRMQAKLILEVTATSQTYLQVDKDEEKTKVAARTRSCTFGPDSTPCSTLLDREVITKTCTDCREMTKAQLHLVV